MPLTRQQRAKQTESAIRAARAVALGAPPPQNPIPIIDLADSDDDAPIPHAVPEAPLPNEDEPEIGAVNDDEDANDLDQLSEDYAISESSADDMDTDSEPARRYHSLAERHRDDHHPQPAGTTVPPPPASTPPPQFYPSVQSLMPDSSLGFQATVCETCGDLGFVEALVYCDCCKTAAVHRSVWLLIALCFMQNFVLAYLCYCPLSSYCLGITPVLIEGYITWFCDTCDGSECGSDPEALNHISNIEKKKSSQHSPLVSVVEDQDMITSSPTIESRTLIVKKIRIMN